MTTMWFFQRNGRKDMRKESGFSLIELLAGMALTAILVTLAVFALRQFWMVRSLHGGRDQVVTQLRAMQETSVAEAHPIVYGMRFPQGPDKDTIGLIQYDGNTGLCRQFETITLDAGTEVVGGTATAFATDPLDAECKGDLAASVTNVTNDKFVFFFGRGTATPGQVTLRNRNLDGRQLVVRVAGPTARIEGL